MAWGYWSATTVSDRGRSPRRNQQQNSSGHASHQQQNHQQQQQQQPQIPITVEERAPVVTQAYPMAMAPNNNVPMVAEFEDLHSQLSRRPSLDLGSMGPQGALAGTRIDCVKGLYEGPRAWQLFISWRSVLDGIGNVYGWFVCLQWVTSSNKLKVMF